MLTRETLLQLNLIHSSASGYMTNPYKIVSVVHPVTGETLSYPALTEKRPDKRDSNALYAQVNHAFTSGILYSSYRYFQDDWGIKAHTVDFKYRQPVTEELYVQPNIRMYTQSAADFYRSMLYNGETPTYASADYRMTKMHSFAIGLKLGYKPSSGGEFTARVEAMRQDGEQHPQDAIGVQKLTDAFPALEAILFTSAIPCRSDALMPVCVKQRPSSPPKIRPAEKRPVSLLTASEGQVVGEFPALGGPCEVLLDMPDPEAARYLIGLAAGEAWRIESKFSRYNASGIVHQINNANGKPVTLDEESGALIDLPTLPPAQRRRV